MTESAQRQVIESLRAADELYHRLVLLVGPSGSGKTEVLRGVAEELETSVINVNLVLASRLIELTGKQRLLRLQDLLSQIVDEVQGVAILDNLEILFDIKLQQDPLRLLRGIARHRVVVASWSGTYANGRLAYAETGHPESRRYDDIGEIVIGMGGADDTGADAPAAGLQKAGQA